MKIQKVNLKKLFKRNKKILVKRYPFPENDENEHLMEDVLKTGLRSEIRETENKLERLIFAYKNGFDSHDTWSLDYSTAKWLVPRLEHLKKTAHGYPNDLKSFKKWQEVLTKMILSMKSIVNRNDGYNFPSKKELAKEQEGLDLFHKYFRNLWD